MFNTTFPSPPQGWTDDETYMGRSTEWSAAPGNAKYLLGKLYGLNNVNPIWVHDPDFGDNLFIFQATLKSGDTLNYLWNGISQEVFRITRPETLEEVRQTIQRFGGCEGDPVGLELEELRVPKGNDGFARDCV